MKEITRLMNILILLYIYCMVQVIEIFEMVLEEFQLMSYNNIFVLHVFIRQVYQIRTRFLNEGGVKKFGLIMIS